MRRTGWFRESYRHSLASKGIKTSTKRQSMAMKGSDKDKIKAVMEANTGGLFSLETPLRKEGFKASVGGSDMGGMVLRVSKGKETVLVGSKKFLSGKHDYEKDGLVMGDEE